MMPEALAADLAPHSERGDVLLRVDGLSMRFPIFKGILRRQVGVISALDNVTFEVARRKTLALVGESGCGKSTAGRSILRLYDPTAGRVLLDGIDITRIKGEELRRMRRRMQMIFQDPQACLNPRMTVGAIVAEPLQEQSTLTSKQRHERVRELLNAVGLSPRFVDRYPHEFSGGQRQRIGIARALALNPDFIVCDEPIAALDVSIQAQIVNLLEDLQERLGLTYLFISHDLAMVAHLAHNVAVMYLGRIVEMAPGNALYQQPLHPYTKALLSAVPIPNPKIERQRERVILIGDVPSPANPPSGCRFRTRCPIAVKRCAVEQPEWRRLGGERFVACHRVE